MVAPKKGRNQTPNQAAIDTNSMTKKEITDTKKQ